MSNPETDPTEEVKTPMGERIPHEMVYAVNPELNVGDWLMYRYGLERKRRLLAQVVGFEVINTDEDGDEDFNHEVPCVNLAFEIADNSGIFRKFRRPWPIWFDPEYKGTLDIFIRSQLAQVNEGEDYVEWGDAEEKVSIKVYEEPYLIFRDEHSTDLLQQCLIEVPPGLISDL